MSWKSKLVCFGLGALSVLSFAPFEIYPLAFLALALLARLIQSSPPKDAFLSGFAFGLGLYLFGVSWVYVSLSTYGGMPLWMGSIAVLGFAALLALFSGLATFTASFFANHSKRRFLCILPFSWVVFEWCKSWVLTGFPWLDLGYTQTPSWLFAWAPVGGIYLVSFMTLLTSILLLQLAQSRSLIQGVGVVLLVMASFALNGISWTSPTKDSLTIGVVQANVPIEEKWLRNTQAGILGQYQSLSEKLNQDAPLDLIVWPETALPLYASNANLDFWQTISPPGTAVLAGLLDHDGQHSYNAAALNCADSEQAPQIYRKRHLVPFGEYMPLAFLFAWVFEYLQLPMSDFAGWQGQQALSCGERLKIGLSICYEDAFANEYKDHLGDATLLVNISEDAWFGDSFAPHQRRQLAQMRAKELGRPLVRAANSGPSLFIDSHGQVQELTAQFETAIARRQVQPMQGSTPFMLFGSWIVWLSLVVLLGSGISRSRYKKR